MSLTLYYPASFRISGKLIHFATKFADSSWIYWGRGYSRRQSKTYPRTHLDDYIKIPNPGDRNRSTTSQCIWVDTTNKPGVEANSSGEEVGQRCTSSLVPRTVTELPNNHCEGIFAQGYPSGVIFSGILWSHWPIRDKTWDRGHKSKISVPIHGTWAKYRVTLVV